MGVCVKECLTSHFEIDITATQGLVNKMSTEKPKQCLACGRGPDATPLIALDYRDEQIWICPQHLPVLIHDPGALVGRLAGAENLSPAEHHD